MYCWVPVWMALKRLALVRRTTADTTKRYFLRHSLGVTLRGTLPGTLRGILPGTLRGTLRVTLPGTLPDTLPGTYDG